MKTRNTITRLIAITMAVAALLAADLFVGGGLLQPVEAQIGDGSVKFISYASTGLVPGERVRLTVNNTEESTGTLSLSFSYYLAHASHSPVGAPFYETEWIQVPRGEFRSSEVRRADLRTEGEPLTGRAQVIVRVNILAAAGSSPENFPGSLEVIEDQVQNDESVQTDSKYRLIILPAKRSTQLAPISFIPGESLSYTFFNPNEEGSEPVRVQAYGYDAIGRLTSTIDPVELRPGESYTARINRDDLRVAGEELTGRLIVATAIQVVSMDGSVRPVNLHVWVERVDNRTGTTKGGPYFTGSVTVSADGF